MRTEQTKFLKNKLMMNKILNEKLRKSGWEEGRCMRIEDVIDACDGKIKGIHENVHNETWTALPWYPKDINGKEEITACTPEEAVVNFYLELQRHEKKNKTDIKNSTDSKKKMEEIH